MLDVEKQARTVEIEAVFTNSNDIKQLLQGYSADVEVILETRPNTLRIPTEAVLENNRVFLFLENEGLLEERTIETGMSNWDHTEVVSGLNAGDLVVVSIDREGVEDGALAKAEQETTP